MLVRLIELKVVACQCNCFVSALFPLHTELKSSLCWTEQGTKVMISSFCLVPYENFILLKCIQTWRYKIIFITTHTFLDAEMYLVKKSFNLDICIISFIVVSLLLSWTTPFSSVTSLTRIVKRTLISSYLHARNKRSTELLYYRVTLLFSISMKYDDASIDIKFLLRQMNLILY